MLVVALGIVVVVQAAYLSRMERRIARLELQTDDVRKTPVAARKTDERTESPLGKAKRGGDTAKKSTPKTAGKSSSAGQSGGLTPALVKSIREATRDEIEAFFRREEERELRERRPPLADVAKKLKLD